MSRSSNFVLGADPELFMSRGGKILSAIGKLGGTKKEPQPVPELGKGFAYQEDNVLVEYNIPPASTSTEFYHFNNVMMDYLKKKVKAEHNATLTIKASHHMDDDQLEDPRAHVFGCDPDFNVWTLEDNPRPQCEDPNLRSAGGHVHIGLKMGKMDKIALGRLLDSTIGLWSVTADKDTARRQLYGKAGSIRFKPYGLEYRTLSNFWLASPDHQGILWQYIERAVARWRANDLSFTEKYAGSILKAINTSDVDLANELLRSQ